jgi:hypothetical protein
MKRVKKLAVGIIVGAVVLVLVVIASAVLWIDHLAKAGVEGGATYALGVRTTLDDMDVGVLSGEVEMSELNIGNPEGFKTPHFLHLDDGGVAVSLGSLMGEKVILPDLTLSGLDVNLERRGGKANYKVIMDNLKKLESKEKRPAEEEKEGKKFVIEKVDIRNVRVNVDLLPIGGELTRIPVTIERIELENVGSDTDGGVLLADVVGILIKAILTTVVQKCGDLLPADVLGELNAGLEQLSGLGATTVQVVGSVTSNVQKTAEQLGEMGKQAGEAIQEGAKEVGKDLDDAGKELEKGIGDLIGGGKKKDSGKKPKGDE